MKRSRYDVWAPFRQRVYDAAIGAASSYRAVRARTHPLARNGRAWALYYRRRRGPMQGGWRQTTFGGRFKAPVSVRSRLRSVNQPLIGQATRQVLHLPYCEYVRATSGVSVGVLQQWNLNDCYDPYRTGAGNQPRWYDQYLNSTSYTKFCVYAASYDVIIHNRSTNSIQTELILYDDAGSAPAAGSLAAVFYQRELKNTQWKLCEGTGTNNHRVGFRGHVYMADVFGLPRKEVYCAGNICGDYNASPAHRAVLCIICAGNPNDAAPVADADIFVRIVYHVVVYSDGLGPVQS